jgi:arginyl-tRNA synthetase
MIKEYLENLIRKSIDGINTDAGSFVVERPLDFKNGDYSTNVAMVLAKKVAENPKELAEKIKAEIEKQKNEIIEKIEVAGAGFINFYIKDKVYIENIENILKEQNKYGSNKILEGKKVMIEYTDPNPFKEFHIGHLMSNAVGESLSRILEFSGAKIIRANYQGDIGLHVAKAIWGIKKLELKNFTSESLGKAYSTGATAYEDNKDEIDKLNKIIYEQSDDKIDKIYKEGKEISMKHFEEIYKILGTKFDEHFFESEVWKNGKDIVMENIGKIFEKSEGAIIFKGEEFGLHTRVFINSSGLPTYETKELGLVEKKFDKFSPDLSISVTGNEVNEYFKVLLRVMELINPLWAEKTKHISHGMLRLPSGKMSSRTGDVITGEFLIKNIASSAYEKIKKEDIKEKEILSEQIAVAAIKYSILKQATGKDIIFDSNKSISFEGDSGPYIQYSFVRAKSILNQSGKKPSVKKAPTMVTNLEKLLQEFPGVLSRATNEYESHYISTYLIELSREFNSYYAKNKIIGSDNEGYGLALVESVSVVIKNGLWLLGIEAPERM